MSLTFGGATSDRVDCGTAAAISNLSAWTWCGWVYVTTVTVTSHRFFFRKADSSPPYSNKSARMMTSGELRVDVERATTSTQYIASTGTVVANEWAFFATTYNEAAGSGEVVNIYKGLLTSPAAEVTYSTTTNGSGATIDDSPATLLLGNGESLAQVLPGRMGPQGFFNRVLTLGEIQSWQFDPRMTAGCVGLWYLGDNGTGTQPDFSGNGNSGTVTGATQSDNPPLPRRWGRQAVIGGPAAAPTVYTLTAESGTFTITGTAATLTYNQVADYTLTAESGTFTVTGSDATLTHNPTVLLTPGTVYQTMRGWEVTAEAGDQEANASLYLDQVIELGAQYGVDAVRLEIKDEWETSDGVYDWSFWDSRVPDFVLPFKEAVERHGRTMRLNLCYVAFGTHSGLHTTAANYADFMLAGVQYLDTTFGLVPDTIEVILEPDNTGGVGVHLNTGAEIGAATKALGDLLATNGYTPGFIVPSALSMSAASTLYDSTTAVSGASAYITTLSYHRYSGVSDPNLAAILSRINADGIESAMLEWITANAETLWVDLTKANVSMWQQYCLAFPTSDDGAQLFPIISNVPTIGSRTPGLAQYFKHVRRGATRIAATSGTANVRPVAFINTDGRYAVVLHADASGTYTVGPVPAGSYYVTRSSTTAARTPLGIVTVGGSGRATLALNSGDIATLAPIEGLASGAIEITGTDANLEFNRRLEAGSGSFAVTGTDAALKYNRLLSAGSGSFAVTGTDASLEFNRRLSAESGTFTVTGSDATLTYNSVGSYTLSCESGTFAVTGSDASLKMNRRLAADSGSSAVTGTDAALKCGRRLSAESGSFTIIGTDATLTYGQPGQYTLVANSGTFTVTGFAANLLVGRRLAADSGACAVTGTAATLLAHRSLTAESGAFVVTGTDAGLVYSAANPTAFRVTARSGPRYLITPRPSV